MKNPALLFLGFLLLLPLYGHAQWTTGGICETIYRAHTHGCDDLARSNSLGGSFPQLFDAFNINPASIPTKLTPVGLELFTSNGDFNLALLKGMNVAGAAFSSSETEAMFFSNMNNYEMAVRSFTTASENKNSTNQGLYSPNYNLGFSVPLLGPNLKSPLAPILGFSLRKNKDTGETKTTVGLSFNTSVIHLGASVEKDSQGEKVFTATGGFKIYKMMADFTYFENQKTVYSTPDRTGIVSATLLWWKLEFNYGHRYQQNSYLTDQDLQTLRQYGYHYQKSHNLFGMQFRPDQKFSLGVFHNYVLGVNYSFVLRYLF
jgi:hypothetical protein